MERFKKNNGKRQRKVMKFVSDKEVAAIEEIMEAAEKFCVQTKQLISNFDIDCYKY